jgi:hypothetical protein
MKFSRKKKADTRSLLKPKRLFGKKAERSDNVGPDETNNIFRHSKSTRIVNQFPPPLPDDDHLNVTSVTLPSSPEEDTQSVSDTISELGASGIHDLPLTIPKATPEEAATEQPSVTFSGHRGGFSQDDNKGETKSTGECPTAPSSFDFLSIVDNACKIPSWKSKTEPEEPLGPTWGEVPSADADSDNGDEGEPMPVMSDVKTTPESVDPTPEKKIETTPMTAPTRMLVAVDETVLSAPETVDETVTSAPDAKADIQTEASRNFSTDESDEQEGYELVLDPKNNTAKPKKHKFPVWKRMKKQPAPTQDPEKYRAVFGSDPEPTTNRTPLSLKRFSYARGKSAPGELTVEPEVEEKKPVTVNPKPKDQKPLMVNPEDLLIDEAADEEGYKDVERPPRTTSPSELLAAVSKKDNVAKSQLEVEQEQGVHLNEVQEHEIHEKVAQEQEVRAEESMGVSKDTPSEDKESAPMSQSRSWGLTSLKKSISLRGVVSEREKENDEVNTSFHSASMGFLGILGGSPPSPQKKVLTEKLKGEESRSAKPVWNSSVDAESGQTYYYHRLTRVTTWTKPADFDEPVNKSVDKPVTAKVAPENLSAESQKKLEEGVEVAAPAEKPSSILRHFSRSGSSETKYTKKQQEIKNLLLSLSPPDPSSVDKIIDEYRGREEELLEQLHDIVESQPFDEPIKPAEVREGPDDEVDEKPKKSGAFQLPRVLPTNKLKRVMTVGSNVTGRSNFTGRSSLTGHSRNTQKAANTAAKRSLHAKLYPASPEDDKVDLHNTLVTSNVSVTEEEAVPVHEKKPKKKEEATPVKVVKALKAPRNRELLVEEFGSGRYDLRAEKYSGTATLRNARLSRKVAAAEQALASKNAEYDTEGGGSEMDESIISDDISALSGSITGFGHRKDEYEPRKDEFEAAAKAALDEAIRNQDWELAATVTEEIRGDNHHIIAAAPRDLTPREWTQSAIDKFITESDWGAVAKYIASMRDSNFAKKEIHDPQNSHASNNYETLAGPARKRFGARSQLQHNELQQEVNSACSSDDDGSLSGSEFSSSGSSAITPSPRRDTRKEFAC